MVAILAANPDAPVVKAIGDDRKGKISLVIYAIGTCLAFVEPWLAYAAFVIVNLLWVIPDRRLKAIIGD